MMRIYTLIFTISCFAAQLSAQIYCPDDIVTSCFSELSIEECGNATVISANYHQSQVKYIDENETNACNFGTVFRTFYVDINYNNQFDESEPNCTQTITLEYTPLPLNLQFPSDIELTCVDAIPESNPTWSAHPCDLIGYTYEDETFEFEEGACLKVIRHFTVINWCEYEADSNQGLYTGIQVIKVIDNEAPELMACQTIEIDAQENCETSVALINSATDMGECPSGMLTWTLSVDLWGDGTEDLFFGPNEPIPFRIDPVSNGENIRVDLPDLVAKSHNKMIWTVKDGCGNVKTCPSTFDVVDNKPPTPYCLNFLSATLNGEDDGKLVIPVDLFVIEGIDNCSSSEVIEFSFSENVEDKERIIECGGTGFQFYRIYYTDEAGNQDFCEVFMFVLDNGSCSASLGLGGVAVRPNGTNLTDVNAYLMEDEAVIAESITDHMGRFGFGQQLLMDSYSATLKHNDSSTEDIDVVDYKLLLDGTLGKTDLGYFQKIAADVNGDKIFDLRDLEEMKSILTGETEIPLEDQWRFIPIMQERDHNQLKYNDPLSIKAYQNGFNFFGVKTGDLSSSELGMLPLTPETQNLDLILEINEDRVLITNRSDFVSSFFKMKINADISSILTTPGLGVINEVFDGVTISNLQKSDIKMGKSDLTIELKNEYSEFISAKSIGNSLLSDVQFLENGSYQLMDVSWTIIDGRNKKIDPKIESEEITVFPQPFRNSITVLGNDISDIKIYSIDGQMIRSSFHGDENSVNVNIAESLPNGIYLLEVTDSKGTSSIKIVK